MILWADAEIMDMNDLLILHGALGTATLMEPLKKVLEAMYQVHTLSFSGHADEAFDDSSFGIQAFAGEVEAFLKARQLISIPVFGYSMGGYVALYLESIKPNTFSQIVTLGTKFDWNPESAKHETARMLPAIISEKVPKFAALLASRHHNWEGLMEATAEMMRSLGNNPLLNAETLAAIKTKTCIMLGDADNMVSRPESEQAAQHLTNGQFKLLENCPHPIEKVDTKMLSQVLVSLF